LEAALHCFSKHGYHGARMDDIVDQSGLSKGAIYWHFKSKEELFLALFDDLEAAIDGSWDQGQGLAPLDAIRLGCSGAIAALATLRPHAQTWAEFLGNPTSRRRLGRAYANARMKLGAVIDRGIEDGLVAPCDSLGAAAAITAMIEGLILQAFTDRRFDLDRAFATSWDLMARGLAPARVS
jgi:AcrR family transcriptional regulator